MTEVPELDVSAGRRHIIKRPRLTRLLDETSARVILLVAPAGYGKTTLAREWVTTRSAHAWVSVRTASADVATFAVEIGRAAAEIMPGSDERLRRHLQVSDAPQLAPGVLAELLARELATWPEQAWVTVDDYHLLQGSGATEEFVGCLLDQSPIRCLATSRLPPKWCTPRLMLYGDVLQIDRTMLAMTQEEAAEVLSTSRRHPVARLVELAEGWPVIIGLAAVAEHLPGANPGLPQALHDYLAEELYQAAPPELQRPIALLSLVPGTISADLAHATLDALAGDVLETAERLGFINRISQGQWELHPLLRDFLHGKLLSGAADELQPAATRIAQRLSASERWDEAFTVIERFGSNRDFESLLDRALSPLLLSGRLETIQYWLTFAARRQIDSVLVDLAEAEVAGRLGLLARSDIHASRADRRLTEADSRTPQLLLLRGRNAILRDRYDVALESYDHARRLARSPHDQRAALWGSFISRRFLEEAGTAEVVAEIAKLPDESVEGVLRLANARFQSHCLLEGEVPILDDMFAALEMIDDASDPQVITAFLQTLGYGLLLRGRYEEGIEIALRELEEAQRYRLSFVVPSARSILAFCELGLGNYATARASFDVVEREARELHDLHNTLNARVGRARILLAHDHATDALEETRNCPPLTSPGMYGEYVGTHAIALACVGRTDEAAAAATEVELASRSFEARSTAACARAILALRTGTSAGVEAAQRHLLVAATATHIDGLVAGYRAYHPLLAAGAQAESLKTVLAEAVRSGRDIPLALTAGMWLPEHAVSAPELTPREREVLHLIARGVTNREAAKALFISEATVKVHVRHIFEKLGVRTRTEAALRAVTHVGYAAPRARTSIPEDS